MLALTRRAGEGITLIDIETNKEIHITVSEIRSSQVVLSFDADKTISIWRDEILDDHLEERIV
jgi:carbon storage regulator CsrA